MRTLQLLAGEAIDDRGGTTALAFLSVGDGCTVATDDGPAIPIPTPCVWPAPDRGRPIRRARLTGPCIVLLCESDYEAQHVQTGGAYPPTGAAVGTPVAVVSQADAALTKVYGAPVAGAQAVRALGAGDDNIVTVPGRQVQLTAVNGDAMYAVDADSTNPANGVLLQAGSSVMVRAGAAIHFSQGPNVGGSIYVAQFA